LPLDAIVKLQPVLTGLGIGLALVLVLLVLLPSKERKLVRGPLVWLAIYAGTRGAMGLLQPEQFPIKILHFAAVFAWCAALIRCLFLLFGSTRLSRVVGRPWPKIVRDVVQAILYVVIALISLRAIGLDPGQLLTTSALLTAILGFSMQDTLGNLFAGLSLQAQQTIAVGDWVRWEEGSEGVGEVTEINWRATHFLTNNRVRVIVPNGVLARAVVRNYSRPTHVVRLEVAISLPYPVSPERVRSLILDGIRGVPGVLIEPEPHLIVVGFGDAGIDYSVRYFVDDYAQRERISGAVRQRIVYAVGRAGIEIPFPHRVLDVGSGFASLVPSLTPPPVSEGRDLAAQLARFEFFKILTPAEIASLVSGSRTALYAPGEAILRQGDSGGDLFALERGRVEVVVSPEGRPPLRVTVLESGAVFGELAFLTGGRRTASVHALAECEVIAVARTAFKQVVDSNPAVAERLTTRLADRMEQIDKAVSDATDGDSRSIRDNELLLQKIRKFFAG
jgi:small-conductance mechanosensitive channel/CRP-like cAMP-binding protein